MIYKNLYSLIKNWYKLFFDRILRTGAYLASKKLKEPCHLNELFIRHDGSLYPCCRVWNNRNLKIGHLSDKDIIEKLNNYFSFCSCFKNKLIQNKSEKIKLKRMNIEFALTCQAKCAMCCVDAPLWKGQYNFYNELNELVENLQPDELFVQGGEVLIQKRTLEWLSSIKKNQPEIDILLVTNGNVDASLFDKVEELFDRLTLSIVGFQPETYKRVMNLELSKTLNFAETLHSRNCVKIFPKYLITPLNIHEVVLFLKWVIQLAPQQAVVADASTLSYINTNTNDSFWEKIILQTSEETKQLLIENKKILLDKKIHIGFDVKSKNLLDINDNFVIGNNLERIIFLNN